MNLNKKSTVDEADIKRLLNLFQKLHMATIWSRVTDPADFVVRRFPQGFVNDICCCELTEQARKRLLASAEPELDTSDIVVKFLCKQMWLEVDYLEMAVIAAIVAEAGISPPILYADEDCHVHHYLPSQHYSYEDDCDPEMVGKLARLLARMHTLRVPVSNMAFRQWKEKFQALTVDDFSRPFIEDHVHMKVLRERVPHLESRFGGVLSDMDAGLISDREFLLQLQEKVGSPVVFAHNDFNRGNRLVARSPGRPIYLIDNDYANYNDRGRDLGRYFSNFRHRDDMFGNEGFPTDDQMEPFLAAYREEILAQLKLQPGDDRHRRYSIQQLRDESKVYTMCSYLDDCWFSLMMFTEQVGQEERFLAIIESRYRGFQRLREMFTQDGTVARVMSQQPA